MNPTSFNIQKPFGEIWEWRCFKRDETVQHRVCDYLSALTSTELAFSDEQKTAIMNSISRFSCVSAFENGPTLFTDIRKIFSGPRPEFMVQSQTTATVNDVLCLLDKRYKDIDSVPFDELRRNLYRVISSDNDGTLLTLQVNFLDSERASILEEWQRIQSVFVFRGMDVVYNLSEQDPLSYYASGGWNGDPLEIRQKSRNSDEASYHMELVFRSSLKKDKVDFEEKGKFEGAIRASETIKRVIESLSDELYMKINEAHERLFESAMQIIQKRMELSWARSFDASREGTYVLLKSFDDNSVTNDDTKAVELREYTYDASGSRKLLLRSGPKLPLPDTSQEAQYTTQAMKNRCKFQIVAGCLQTMENMELSDSRTAYAGNRTISATSAMDMNKFLRIGHLKGYDMVDFSDSCGKSIPFSVSNFLSEGSEDTDFFAPTGRQAISNISIDGDAMKLRLATLSSQAAKAIEDEIPTTFDPMNPDAYTPQPFEHQLHSGDDSQILTEIRTCLRLIGHCLFSTFKDSNNYSEEKSQVQAYMPETIPERCEDPQEGNLDVNPSKFFSLVNRLRPWRNDYDLEEGSCCKSLWQPLLEFSEKFESNKNLGLPLVGSYLVNLIPFGPLNPDLESMVDKIIEEFFEDTHLFESKNSLKCFTLVRDDNAPDMPYDPLTLNFGFHMENGSDFDSFAWSIGTTPALFAEALQVQAMYLQKLVCDCSRSTLSENKVSDVVYRERVSGWDTYPMGMVSKEQLGDIFCGQACLRPSTLNSFNSFDVSCSQTRPLTHDASQQLGLSPPDSKRLTFIPGNPAFYRSRGWVRKEILYGPFSNRGSRESMTFTGVDWNEPTLFSAARGSGGLRWHRSETTANVRTNTYAFEDKRSRQTLFNNRALKRIRVDPDARKGFWSVGIAAQSPEVLYYDDLTSQRYRKYTGSLQESSVAMSEEAMYQTSTVASFCQDRPTKAHYIFPDIVVGTPGASPFGGDLSQWLSKTFVGFHYSTRKSGGKTEFALASGKHYDSIESYFSRVDTLTGEEFGIKVISPKSHQKVEASLLQMLGRGRFGERSGVSSAQQRQKLVVPGVVLVKGGTEGHVITRCVLDEFVVKTETYRIVESEVWAQLTKTLKQYPKVPKEANKNCMACKLLSMGIDTLTPMSIRKLLRLRPTSWASLARLMLALHIHNESWVNSKQYHYKDGVQSGKC